MKNIKHVYFDVGGVTLLDFSGTNKWVQMKRDLGITEHQDPMFDAVWKKYRKRICVDYDVDLIIKELESSLSTEFPKNYSMLTDFVNRFESNSSIWPIIEASQKIYKIGLLTNMYPRMLDTIKQRHLIPNIKWDTIVDSSIVGVQKPEEKIFKIAEKMAKTEPELIAFIDNSPEHVEAAKKRGWKTVLYDPQNQEESNTKIVELLGLDV